MPESEIRNSKSEFRTIHEVHRSAGILVRSRERTEDWFGNVVRLTAAVLLRIRMSALQAVSRGPATVIRFQKYRVAPRIGTDTVRRRLLRRLHEHAPLSAIETGFA